ncbi:hypothetical protein P8452_55395 [Trifolium repens]|nr:hypothetical protein P8452_55395 [Trifolium repens]
MSIWPEKKMGFNSMAKEIKTVQLTMFYNGEVIVLDDFLDDKVITSKLPYSIPNKQSISASVKPAESIPWLVLGTKSM